MDKQEIMLRHKHNNNVLTMQLTALVLMKIGLFILVPHITSHRIFTICPLTHIMIEVKTLCMVMVKNTKPLIQDLHVYLHILGL